MSETGGEKITTVVERALDPHDAFTPTDAVIAVTVDDVLAVLHPRFDAAEGAGADHDTRLLATGLGASPGAAVGEICLSADEAADAADEGRPVILVVTETTPADVHGMQVAEGIVTTRGGQASHAAVVARGWGIPAVVGADALTIDAHGFSVGGRRVERGEFLSIDGSSGTVVLGAQALGGTTAPTDGTTDKSSDGPEAALAQLLAWADEASTGGPVVFANADTGEEASVARAMGAVGIGLCRTEHQFLGDRLPLIRRFILATDADEEAEALAALGERQHADFVELLEAMDGLPVTVRLLDPPLHEFLPDIEELAVREASEGLTEAQTRELAAARNWREANPMLGVRGVRLGLLRESLYRMQIRALLQARQDRVAAGGNPTVEVLVPLVVTPVELARLRTWVADESSTEAHRDTAPVRVGAMIETPRAALVAGELAEHADFLSFGTNDLTQMTFGFSRDDIEGRLMAPYLAAGILDENPFQHLDRRGVGALIEMAVERARAIEPTIKLGICGEHGGDPESISWLRSAGLDYISCSTFRVPVARLTLAHLALSEAT